MPVYTVEIGNKRYDVEASSEQAAISAAQQYASSQRVGLAEDVGRSALGGLPLAAADVLGSAGTAREVMAPTERAAGLPMGSAFGAIPMIGPALQQLIRAAPSGQQLERSAREAGLVYEPQTALGNVAQQGVRFGASAAATPIGGTALGRGLMGTLSGASSEAVGQTLENVYNVSPEKADIARMATAVGVPLAAELGLSRLRSSLVGEPEAYSLGSERASAVRALEDFGVTKMTAGQRIGAPSLIMAEGAESTGNQLRREINAAAIKMTGSDAPRPTSGAMLERKQALGGVFQEAADLNPVPVRANAAAAQQALAEFDQLSEAARRPQVFDDIAKALDEASVFGKPISGQAIQDWRAKLDTFSSAATPSGASVRVAELFDDILDELIMQGAQGTNLYDRLVAARPLYRNFRTLTRALNRSGSSGGLVTPENLASAVRAREGEVAWATGQLTDLGRLAKAAEEVTKSLPTVEAGAKRNVAITGGLGGLGLIGSATTMDIKPLAAAALAASIPPASRAAIRSGPMQTYLQQPPTWLELLNTLGLRSAQLAPSVGAMPSAGPR